MMCDSSFSSVLFFRVFFFFVICARDFYLSSFSLLSFSCLVFFRHFHHDLNVHIIFRTFLNFSCIFIFCDFVFGLGLVLSGVLGG